MPPGGRPLRRIAMTKTAALVAVLLAVLSGLPQTASAAAPITVGDGTAASCTEAALRDALIVAGAEGGGRIHFNCGADPVTITVTATLTVPNNTRINGIGLITLDGQGTTNVLRVDRDTTVALNRLTIHRSGCRLAPPCGEVVSSMRAHSRSATACSITMGSS